MTIRAIVLMVFALVAAAGTAVFARTWVAAQRAQVQTVMVEKSTPQAEILVASADLPAGEFIQEKHLKWQAWPKDGVGDGYVAKAGTDAEVTSLRQGFVGAVVRSQITAGEPITKKRIVQPGDRGFLAAVLTPGTRAVSVPVNATTGIAGFVFPGDKVDLILTVKFSGGEGSEKQTRYVSKTMLAAIRVVAIDQKTEQTDGDVKPVKNVTLEVTPEQAEKIAIGLQMGALSLSLNSLARVGEDGLAVADTADAPVVKDKREYTLDRDVFSFGKGNKASGTRVEVLRGSKSEKAKF